MDRQLELMISETVRGLERTEGDGAAEQMDFTGFRGRVERMSDLLIAALFPQHAGQLTPDRGLLRQNQCFCHVVFAFLRPVSCPM